MPAVSTYCPHYFWRHCCLDQNFRGRFAKFKECRYLLLTFECASNELYFPVATHDSKNRCVSNVLNMSWVLSRLQNLIPIAKPSDAWNEQTEQFPLTLVNFFQMKHRRKRPGAFNSYLHFQQRADNSTCLVLNFACIIHSRWRSWQT